MAPATNDELMKRFINAKGPLSIFRYKWISKVFSKDIVKGTRDDIQLKTDNWLDEIVQNPPDLNLVYTLREYQPFADEFPNENFKFLGPSVYERKEESIEFVKTGNPLIYISLGTVMRKWM